MRYVGRIAVIDDDTRSVEVHVISGVAYLLFCDDALNDDMRVIGCISFEMDQFQAASEGAHCFVDEGENRLEVRPDRDGVSFRFRFKGFPFFAEWRVGPGWVNTPLTLYADSVPPEVFRTG